MSAEQVVPFRFGIADALPSISQRCISVPPQRVGVGTEDPTMNAEQVVPSRFGITSALPSTSQRCISVPPQRVGVGTGDPKIGAEQIRAGSSTPFGYRQCPS